MARLPYQRVIIAACLIGALICLALILAGCSHSRVGRSLTVGVVLAGSADVVTTRLAIDSGQGREANPVMGHGLIQQALVKSVGVASVIGVAHLSELKGRPILAHLIRATAIAVWSGVAIHNYRLAR